MKLFQCDRCGKTEPGNEDGSAEDWENVTISGIHYDVCQECGRLLFKFFTHRYPQENPILAEVDKCRST